MATANWRSPHYLRCSCDHVFDEVPMSWSIYDCDVELAGLKLPQRDVNCNATLTFGLQFIQNPCILEGTLPHLWEIKQKNT